MNDAQILQDEFSNVELVENGTKAQNIQPLKTDTTQYVSDHIAQNVFDSEHFKSYAICKHILMQNQLCQLQKSQGKEHVGILRKKVYLK